MRRRCNTQMLLLFAMLSFYANTESAKILILPPPVYSHCVLFRSLAEELMNRGHTIFAYTANTEISDKCLGEVIVNRINYTMPDMLKPHDQDDPRPPTNYEAIMSAQRAGEVFCASALGDEGNLLKIQKLKVDLILINSLTETRCFLLIPYRFKIPFITVSSESLEWYDSGNLFTPHLRPHFLPGYSGKMTFSQRIANTAVSLISPFYILWNVHNRVIGEFAPELSFYKYLSFIQQSVLFIEDGDLLLHGPHPVLPNTLYTGSFTLRRANSLPKDIADFYQESEEGVMVVAFGSSVDRYTKSFSNILSTLFSGVRYNVLWRNEEASPLKNVLTREWIPQNDVLGHNKTYVFICHCGKKSFYEAVYHAVPIICIPLYWDQYKAATRAVSIGIGLQLDYNTLTTSELTKAVSTILTNDTFKRSVNRWSQIYRDSHPQPASETAAFAIEHVIRYGGQHLRQITLDMSLTSLFLLDMWYVCMCVIGLLIVASYLCYKLLQRCRC